MNSRKPDTLSSERNYIAFISYRHKPYDIAVATRIHTLIERYRVPRSLRSHSGRKLGIAFRDQDELSVSDDLSADIQKALDHSQYLIVVCTPDTPASVWVNKEIAYFLRSHSHSSVLAILASGSPDESFPFALTHPAHADDTAVEPLAANICSPSEKASIRLLSKESLRLFAAMLQCPYDQLIQREHKRRQRTAVIAAAAAFSVLLGYAGILLRSNRMIESKNLELDAMNTSLIRQKEALQASESALLTASAETALADGDAVQAVRSCIAALPSGEDDDRPYHAPAEKALFSALDLFGESSSLSVVNEKIIELSAPVRTCQAADSVSSLIVLDEYDVLSSYNPFSSELNWSLSLSTVSANPLMVPHGQAVFRIDRQEGMVYALYGNELFAVDIESGKINWQSGSEHRYTHFFMDEASRKLICTEQLSTVDFRLSGLDIVLLDIKNEYQRQSVSVIGQPGFRDFALSAAGITHPDRPVFFAGAGGAILTFVCERKEDRIYTHYYRIDPVTNEAVEFYAEVGSEAPSVLWIGMAEAAEKPSAAIVTRSASNPGALTIEGISLDTDSLLFSRNILSPAVQGDEAPAAGTIVQPWQQNLLLVSHGNDLSVIDQTTGETIDQLHFASPVLSIFSISPDSFGYILRDGTYEAVYRSDDAFSFSSGWDIIAHFGSVDTACAGGAGCIKPLMSGSVFLGFAADTAVNAGGYIAVTDPLDHRHIRVDQLISIDKPANTVFLSLSPDQFSPANYIPIAGMPVRIRTDGTLMFASAGQSEEALSCYAYTPASSSVPLQEYTGNLFETDAVWPILQSNAILIQSPAGNMESFDFATGSRKRLSSDSPDSGNQSAAFRKQGSARKYDTKSVSLWIPGSDSVLTLQCDGLNILQWIDGELIRKIPVPDDITWSISVGNDLASVLEAGENGYVLLSSYPESSAADSMHSFALLNPDDGTWIQVEDMNHGDSRRHFVLGNEKDCFAVYESDSTIHIYSISEGKPVQTLFPNISVRNAADCRFIDQDRYFAVCSADGMISIYDTATAACVFSGLFSGNGMTECGRISAHTDSLHKRIYILEHENHAGLCFDLASWTLLGEIPNVYGFDSLSDSLYCYSESKEDLYCRSVPSLQALIDWGHAVFP